MRPRVRLLTRLPKALHCGRIPTLSAPLRFVSLVVSSQNLENRRFFFFPPFLSSQHHIASLFLSCFFFLPRRIVIDYMFFSLFSRFFRFLFSRIFIRTNRRMFSFSSLFFFETRSLPPIFSCLFFCLQHGKKRDVPSKTPISHPSPLHFTSLKERKNLASEDFLIEHAPTPCYLFSLVLALFL